VLFANSDLGYVQFEFFLASRKCVHYLHYYLDRTTHARANLDKLGYLGCFENNSFISHISPQKVPTSEKLTEHNVQNEDSLSSELGR
jgi:hypothetical protein